METAACIVTLMREGGLHIYASDQSKISRRDLLKTAAIGAIGATTLVSTQRLMLRPLRFTPVPAQKNQTMIGVKFEPRDVVRIGIVGVGLRGTEVLGNSLQSTRW